MRLIMSDASMAIAIDAIDIRPAVIKLTVITVFIFVSIVFDPNP